MKHLFEKHKIIKNAANKHDFWLLPLGILFLPIYILVGIAYGVQEFLLIWFHCLIWQDREILTP
jgi:uncharacterized membrane protein HdeD (DUF308 family)